MHPSMFVLFVIVMMVRAAEPPISNDNVTLKDWSTQFSVRVKRNVIVRDEENLRFWVQHACMNNRSLSVYGARHSSNAIWGPDEEGIALNITGLDWVSIDTQAMEATVGAGIVLHKLLSQLAERNFSIDSVGGVTHQTVSGALSTGTLPASPIHNMGWVKSLRVLRWNGTSLYESVVDVDSKEYFLGLGFQYVIVEVVIRIVPLARFDVEERVISLEQLKSSLDKFNQEHQFWRVNWISSIGKVLLWTASEAHEFHPDALYNGDVLVNHVLKYASDLLHLFGCSNDVPLWAQKAFYGSMAAFYKPTTYHGDLGAMLPRDQTVSNPVVQAEWFFRRANVLQVFEIILEVFNKQGHNFLPTEFEPVRSIHHHLSPAYSEDPAEIFYKFNFMYDINNKKEDYLRRLRAIWDAIIAAGIPIRWHWGKIHFADREHAEKTHGKDVVKHFIDEAMPALHNQYFHQAFNKKSEDDIGSANSGLQSTAVTAPKVTFV